MGDSKQEVISVIGAGYVGLTTAAIFANCRYKVYLIDINKDRINKIKTGKSWFFEPGIDQLVEAAIDQKNLIPTTSYDTAIPDSDFIFSCVSTPENPDGSPNLSYAVNSFESCLPLLKEKAVFIQKSTVPVGTGAQLEALAAKRRLPVTYVSSPEFLREGSAITDTLWFDRIVCGSDNTEAAEAVIGLYRQLEQCRGHIATLAELKPKQSNGGNYIITTRNSAELIKVTSNAFLALKISFANNIAKLADATGADINEVMDAVGADHRIGRAFLSAGRGYGGGCFPKDVSGLIASAAEYDVDMPILAAATDINESMPGYIANKAQERLGTLTGKNVAVLGLSFKAGTSDARQSPGVKLANILARSGAAVSVYDPHANGEAKAELRNDISISHSAMEAIAGTDAIFIATNWQDFLELDITQTRRAMSGTLFVDCMNAFDISDVERCGLQYIGVGRNGVVA